jgi:hypothetical protein
VNLFCFFREDPVRHGEQVQDDGVHELVWRHLAAIPAIRKRHADEGQHLPLFVAIIYLSHSPLFAAPPVCGSGLRVCLRAAY